MCMSLGQMSARGPGSKSFGQRCFSGIFGKRGVVEKKLLRVEMWEFVQEYEIPTWP